MCWLACFILFHRSLIFLWYFFSFGFVCCPNWVIPLFYPLRHLFVPLHYSFCSSMPLAQFATLQMNFLIFLGSSYFLVPFENNCITVHICSNSFIFALNSSRIYTVSFLNLASIRLKRSVSLFAPSGNSPVLLTVSYFWDSSFCLYFSHSVSLGRTTTVVLEGYLHVRATWVVCDGLIFFFFFFLSGGLLWVCMLAVSFLSVYRLLSCW